MNRWRRPAFSGLPVLFILLLFALFPALPANGEDDLPDIFAAIIRGDLGTLKYRVEHNKRAITQQDRDERGPLHYAVLYQRLHCARYLLEQGAGVDARDIIGKTPLHYAVRLTNRALTELLLAKGANVSVPGKDGRSPLHDAALRGSLANVRVLLKAGADAARRDKQGNTPLHLAARACQLPLVELLIQQTNTIAVKNTAGDTALLIAGRYSCWELIRPLCAHGALPEAKDSRGASLLHYCSSSVFRTRCRTEGMGSVRGESVFTRNSGAITVLEFLLRRGLKPDARDNWGKSALHYAAASGNTAAVKRLLAAGASPELRDYDGYRPWERASQAGYTKLAALLRKKAERGDD